MQNFVSFFNILLSVGIIVYILFIILALVFYKKTAVQVFYKRYSLLFVFVISFIATTSSLIYSNAVGFLPCDLCWYQRIAMYPIALLSLVALFKKQSLSGIRWQVNTLAISGMIIALFHNLIYYTGINPISCSATASCTARYVFEFGFATIPLMALVSFLLILVVANTSKNN